MIPHSKTTLTKLDLEEILVPIDKGLITAGELNISFEVKLAEFLAVKGVRLSSSGTLAFYRILKTLQLKKGDDVLIPDYICNSLIHPILSLSGNVVTYDNQKNHWLTSAEKIINAVTPNTKVVVVNHTFGLIFSEMEQLREQLPTRIHIIEDCCHAIIPNRVLGKYEIGKHSICCFYSFNATKYIATGEGGAISSNDEAFLEALDEFSIGDNLSDVACSLGLSQLKQLTSFIEKRNYIAEMYTDSFGSYSEHFKNNKNPSTFFRYPIRVKNNEKFWESSDVLYKRGVDSLINEKLNMPLKPNAKDIVKTTVSLPIYPSLTDKEIQMVIDTTSNLLEYDN